MPDNGAKGRKLAITEEWALRSLERVTDPELPCTEEQETPQVPANSLLDQGRLGTDSHAEASITRRARRRWGPRERRGGRGDNRRIPKRLPAPPSRLAELRNPNELRLQANWPASA